MNAFALPAATVPSKAQVSRYAEQLLHDNYAVDGPGAAVIVARDDEIVFRGARGLADCATATPLSPSSVFGIGSITKQFAAAGLLKLVEAGKVALTDPLAKFIANYPNGENITVLQLLNHTSGIGNYTDAGYIDAAAGADITTAQLIDTFAKAPAEFAPGTGWAYDNSGYVLVGAVIEAASGMTWQAYLEQALFRPLRLQHTGPVTDPRIAAAQVRGYSLVDGKATPARRVSLIAADGALASNVDDLLRWNRALHTGHVLAAASYRRMITPLGKAVPEHYGFGLWITSLRQQTLIGHSGHVPGFSAYLLYLPDAHISVVILQNMERSAAVVDPAENARRLAAFAIGAAYSAPTQVVVDPAALRRAEGSFGRDPAGAAFARTQGARVLRLVHGTLTLARTGGERSALVALAGDGFQVRNGLDRVQLEHDATGAVNALRFFAEGEGDGELLVRTGAAQAGEAATFLPAPGTLSRLTGSYDNDGVALRVFLDGEQLKAQLADQPVVELIAEAPGKFFVAEVDATLAFEPFETAAQTARLRQGSEVVSFRRKP